MNAYHQPGVEAGKKAAAAVLDLQKRVVTHLVSTDRAETAGAIAEAIGQPDDVEMIYKVVEHLSRNGRGITMKSANAPHAATFRAGAGVPQRA